MSSLTSTLRVSKTQRRDPRRQHGLNHIRFLRSNGNLREFVPTFIDLQMKKIYL